MESVPLNHSYQEEYKLYHRRWYILFLFSLLSCNQSNIWISYGAVMDTAKAYYETDSAHINLLTAMGPVGFIPLTFVTSWAISRYGLRVSSIVAAVLCTAGAILRCFADASTFWIVIAAQFLNALAGPLVMIGPPALSAIWFGVNERTLATAISSLANSLGSALGFLLGLLVSTNSQLYHLLVYEAIATTALLIIMLIYFPSLPPSPPSLSSSSSLKKEPMSLKESMGVLMSGSFDVLKSKDGMLILLAAGLSSGMNGGWSSMLVDILDDFYDQWDIQWLGFVNILSGVIGGIATGKLHDHFRHFKYIMCIFFIIAGGTFVILALACQRIIVCSFMIIMILNVIIGFSLNAVYPVSFEGLAEVTYPAKEEVGSGLLTLLNNIACLALLIIGNYETGNFINWVMVIVCFLCFFWMLMVNEKYTRTKLDLRVL